jgi:hypothetical protein
VAQCCSPAGYRKIFGERTARRDVRKYRRRGLDRAARQIADFLIARGIEGDSVLEAGGGVGAIQLELLKAGAAHTTNVELSPEYEPFAAELLGGDTRVERRLGDFVLEEVEAADDVVLHRVVCCYPDAKTLVGTAASRARRRLVLSFPPDTALFRFGSRLFNLFLAVTRTEFRTFVHPADTIHGAARAHGFEPVADGRTPMWRIVGFERARPEEGETGAPGGRN